FADAHPHSRSRGRIPACRSFAPGREGVAERKAWLVFRRGRGTVEVPHLPDPISGAVIALVDLRGTNAKGRGRKPPDCLAAFRFDAPDILAGKPCHIADYLQTQANRLGDFGDCVVTLQSLPKPGLFLEAVIRVTVQVVLEIALTGEYRAHLRNVEGKVRLPPPAVQPQNFLAIDLDGHNPPRSRMVRALPPSSSRRPRSLVTRGFPLRRGGGRLSIYGKTQTRKSGAGRIGHGAGLHGYVAGLWRSR